MRCPSVLVLAAALARLASAETITVSLDTSGLIGHPAGPFSLEFQLTDGSSLGDGNNTFQLTSFLFDSGSAQGSPTLQGSASGDLTSGVTLTDASFLNKLTQQFSPGSSLSFVIQYTTNVDSGSPPDEFGFEILDSSGAALPSTSFATLGFDSQLIIDIDSSNPAAQTFALDNTTPPAAGGSPITMDAPTVTPGGPPPPVNTPEPGSIWLLATGVVAVVWRHLTRTLGAAQNSHHAGPRDAARRRDALAKTTLVGEELELIEAIVPRSACPARTH
jgi:hypothetical protein